MFDQTMKSADNSLVAPPLAPRSYTEFLQEADDLLNLMGSAPLDVVTRAAKMLSVSARGVEALKIAKAADAVSRISSAHAAVMLTSAMRELSAAIAQAGRLHA